MGHIRTQELEESRSQAQCGRPIIPATVEAKVGASWIQGHPDQLLVTLSQNKES